MYLVDKGPFHDDGWWVALQDVYVRVIYLRSTKGTLLAIIVVGRRSACIKEYVILCRSTAYE